MYIFLAVPAGILQFPFFGHDLQYVKIIITIGKIH